MSDVKLYLGDCLETMKSLPDESVDAVVTDPPYGLTSITKRFGKNGSAEAKYGTDGRFNRPSKGFMGKEWDGSGIEYNVEMWGEVLRLMKPGAHLLAFGGTRTYHRMACAIEDAGFEIRDQIQWLYGSGFPKSHNLDGEWQGWGTALKPANEPICLARKPIDGTVADNVLEHGTGAINIDGCRIEGEPVPINKLEEWSGFGQKVRPDYKQEMNTKGRWPANVILDEEAAKALDGQSGLSNCASRFFYVAKASRSERNAGLVGMEERESGAYGEFAGDGRGRQTEHTPRQNFHPTVKPVTLMRYLCRLITPPGGIVLDPFMGSGSTGCGAVMEGFNFIGIEIDGSYYHIAEKRIEHWKNSNQESLFQGDTNEI